MNTLKGFFSTYPEIKPKSSFYKFIKYKNDPVLIDLEYVRDKDIPLFASDRKTADFRNILFKAYWEGLEKFIDMFFVLLAKDKNRALKAFGLFLYELANYDVNVCYHAVQEATSIRDLAKSFGIHRLPKFCVNSIFLNTSFGFNYGNTNYGLILKPSIKALIRLTNSLRHYLEEHIGSDLMFYELRVKAPFDVYEKLTQHSLNENNVFDLHDLVGLRIVFKEDENREEQMRNIEKSLLTYIKSTACLKIDEKPKTSKESIKRYYEKPKENGYNRLHLLCRLLNFPPHIPVEIQVDTHENYRMLENNIDTIHGVQKYLMSHIKIIRKGTVEIKIIISIREGGRHIKADHVLRAFKDEKIITNCLQEVLSAYFDKGDIRWIINSCIGSILKMEKVAIKIIKNKGLEVVLNEWK